MNMLKHCRELKFNEEPNYDYLKGQVRQLFKANKFVNDFKYDWVQLHKENMKVVMAGK